MRTTTKVWFIIAASLVLIGGIIFVGVMTTLKWDFSELETVNYEINTYEISQEFESIAINTDTADITFALTDDGKCRVVCKEEENAKHFVAVENGTLTVKQIDERTVHNLIGYIGLNFDTTEITVYLSKTEYTSLLIDDSTGDIEIPKDFNFRDVDISLSTGDVDFGASVSDSLKIKTSTGDICAKDLAVGVLDVTVSTGKVSLTDIRCKSVVSSGNTGDVYLNNVIVTEKIYIERSTGDVRLDGSDAAEILIKTDTGDIEGKLLSDKIFFAESNTGRVNVPKTSSGGKCELTTNTGDIKIIVE